MHTNISNSTSVSNMSRPFVCEKKQVYGSNQNIIYSLKSLTVIRSISTRVIHNLNSNDYHLSPFVLLS